MACVVNGVELAWSVCQCLVCLLASGLWGLFFVWFLSGAWVELIVHSPVWRRWRWISRFLSGQAESLPLASDVAAVRGHRQSCWWPLCHSRCAVPECYWSSLPANRSASSMVRTIVSLIRQRNLASYPNSSGLLFQQTEALGKTMLE